MTKTKGHSSDILKELYGNTKKYVVTLDKWGKNLCETYPNKNLSIVFSGLSKHIITIMPMTICDSLASDLGKKADSQILAAIGLSCFLISTHDDVVDEKPQERTTLARLTYGGDIAGLYGVKLLSRRQDRLILQTLIEEIAQNHWLQQLTIEKLWQGKKVTADEYLDGIKHICAFTTIGPLCALALAKRMDLKRKILEFAKGYGIALQIIDDLREMEEDKKSGYSSLPLSEGPPFTKTFEQFYLNIIKARENIAPEWERMQMLVSNLEKFGKSLEEEINKGDKKIVILVSGLLQNRNNEVLLLKRSRKNTSNKGRWQLPEGKMEIGETPMQTLIREVKEETGLKAWNPKLLMQFAHPMKVKGRRYHIVRIVFKLSWSGKIVLSQDHTQFGWFTASKARTLDTIAGTKRIIKSLL